MRALAVSTVLALGAVAAPLATAAPHPAVHAATHSAHSTHSAPDASALRAAISGLPDQDATAALVRVGGTSGSWHGVAGVRDLRTGAKALENARFRAGSTTKVVTAAVVLRLAADGRVDLDAPVQEYLPDLFAPNAGAFPDPISVRRLLNHTSGLKPGTSWGADFEEAYSHRFETLTPRQVVAGSVAAGRAHAPGTVQEYLGINYTLLGLLVEKVTGRPFAAGAERLVLRPAGMRHTYFPGTDPRIRGPHNRGYQLSGGKLLDVTEWNQYDRLAGGDMISTTADLERLITSLFRGRIVPQPQLREMFTVPAGIEGATMSAGLQRFTSDDGKVVWLKTGSRYGYNSVVGATRDLSRTLVYSVNSTDAKGEDMNAVAQRIVLATLKNLD
ncbi:beta-lactamase family protein [Streptomyces kunmingensis]|uniref:Beta-lactamase family protein n=1 Tax=Streptomyces kunmingensis TaxID=68225 RepID=A0ABU6C5Z3_9ACTN|nr:serine hydrolase domain-containing protein [Streptomyces kunmingensis]MEB3959536.1 beta-lactamase family protein [Streptomyces kunmingensis]